MKHYCTYFDSGFLVQGLSLWASLRAHDPSAVLWVLALDYEAHCALCNRHQENLRSLMLSNIEAARPQLLKIKQERSRAEYYFTLSPIWPLWLLDNHAEIERITYLDADMFFFRTITDVLVEMDQRAASVMITGHRFPQSLAHLNVWGRYNVGILSFKNDQHARRILEDWQERCLDWCFDRLEGDRFADQKYLDAWPERFGQTVWVCGHPGLNAAPWNWITESWEIDSRGVSVGGKPLLLYHFAKFKPVRDRIWDSGQVEFAVMPGPLRERIYGVYYDAMQIVRTELGTEQPGVATPTLRRQRRGLKRWLIAVLFGAFWVRLGSRWIPLGFSFLGRFSGRILSKWRKG